MSGRRTRASRSFQTDRGPVSGASPPEPEAAASTTVSAATSSGEGSPRTMQQDPRYGDVVGEILGFFEKIQKFAWSAGIRRDKILLDPGIGFGKLPRHNVEILRRLDEFRGLGRPLVIGTSRKSFIGRALGRRVDERQFGTAATLTAAVLRGADVVRVHDVREMSDVVRMSDLLR